MSKVNERALKAYEIICDNPGITTWGISKKLGIDSRAMDGVLANMERLQLLVYQDGKRLYKYEKD